MKLTYLIPLLMVAVAAALIYNVGVDEVSPYASFGTAEESGRRVKLVGTLVQDKPTVFDPVTDPNYFSFFLEDNEGIEREVVLLQGKPQDFEQSESIVLTGRMKGEQFIASDIQLKCPSKYKDEETALKDLI